MFVLRIAATAAADLTLVAAVNELGERESEVFVEKVANHAGDAVVHLIAVDEEEVAKETELGNRKVRGHDSLHSLVSGDADAEMSGLDHRDIIGAVSYGERDLPSVVTHKASHKRLLERTDAAADHRLASPPDLQQ